MKKYLQKVLKIGLSKVATVEDVDEWIRWFIPKDCISSIVPNVEGSKCTFNILNTYLIAARVGDNSSIILEIMKIDGNGISLGRLSNGIFKDYCDFSPDFRYTIKTVGDIIRIVNPLRSNVLYGIPYEVSGKSIALSKFHEVLIGIEDDVIEYNIHFSSNAISFELNERSILIEVGVRVDYDSKLNTIYKYSLKVFRKNMGGSQLSFFKCDLMNEIGTENLNNLIEVIKKYNGIYR